MTTQTVYLSDTTNFPSTSYVQVNSCGVAQAHLYDLKSTRPNGRKDYFLLYLTKGKCTVDYDGKKHVLHKDEYVIYPPFFRQHYILHKDSSYMWVHFNGFEIKNIISEAHLSAGINKTTDVVSVHSMFKKLIFEFNNKEIVSNEKGFLISLLYTLGKSLHTGQRNLKKQIEQMLERFDEDINVQDLAASCNLSVSHFMREFKSVTGTSPKKYQQTLRINNAKLLLSSTDLLVSEISTCCGFSDPLYFSRLFKKVVGTSPATYRKNSI